MLSRLRPVTRRRRSFGNGEDRQQFLVTALFIGTIVVVVAILVGALALRFYDENLRAVARVGGVELRPDVTRDRAELLQLRITREEGRVRQAQINREIDAATMDRRLQELTNQGNEIPTLATQGLIDLVYQSQLASERGIAVGDGDVDARMTEELSSPERRRIQAIF